MAIEFMSKACGIDGLDTIFYYAVLVIRVIQIAVPIALIIWGSIDLLKGIIAGDEKKISAARKPFIQRLVSAVIVFLVPWIVNTAINFVASDTEWVKCYKAASESKGINKKSSDPATFGTKK